MTNGKPYKVLSYAKYINRIWYYWKIWEVYWKYQWNPIHFWVPHTRRQTLGIHYYNCDENLGLHFANHYFTNRCQEPYAQQIPFTSYVDLSGILQILLTINNFIHCEQNEVKYYNCHMDIEENVIKYVFWGRSET